MQDNTDFNPQRNWIYAILILGVFECVLIALILIEPAPTNATGIAHASVPSMIIGGDSGRFAAIANYGFWFQIIVLAQAHCLAALGVKHEKRTTNFLIMLGVCYLLAVFVWWQMFAGYEAFVATGATDYFLGFPTATAWQTYGLWFSGFGLIAIYSFGFRHYVWSDDDQATFDALTAKHAQSSAASTETGA